MSRRDWLRYGASALVITLALLVGLFWLVADYRQNQAAERQHAANYEPESTEQKLYDPCLRLSGIVDSINCVLREAQAQREDQRSAYDLEAQQDMSAWAYGMLWVSGVGTIIALVGVVFIALTLHTNTAQVRLAREAMVADQRAWIKIDWEVVSDLVFGEDEASVRVKFTQNNTGRSPALGAMIWREHMPITPEHDLIKSTLEEFRRAQIVAFDAEPSGIDIFPEEDYSVTYTITIPSPPDKIKQDNWVYHPCIIVWAGYKSGFSEALHETVKALALFHIVDGKRAGVAWSADGIPRDELDLLPVPGCDITT